ncbi:MAG: aspartate/glutamate racemase family protein [Actinomycetia bacterium]|nr:aspartate/glutamate racemase family protein [Actinomycetes bacterium]
MRKKVKNMKKVALIHTGFALVDVLTKLFKELVPDAELVHIVDDSLLREVLAKGKVTKPVIARMLNYYKSAEYYEVDCILNVCSSVGEVADIAREIISTPIVKIDEKMAEEAVARSLNIGVAATLKTTLDPTTRMIEKKALAAGKKIKITKTVCPGAFKELMNGNPAKHDEIVLNGIKELADKINIIVFAQGSMARLTANLNKDLADRILTSPKSGVLEVKRILEL